MYRISTVCICRQNLFIDIYVCSENIKTCKDNNRTQLQNEGRDRKGDRLKL